MDAEERGGRTWVDGDEAHDSAANIAEETEHVLTKLFAAAGIARIICIDDVFAADFDTFVAQLAGFGAEQIAAVFGGTREEYSVDGVWQVRAREAWEGLARPEQASLVDKAYAIAGDDDPVSKGVVHALQQVLPDSLKLLGLSLSQWREKKDTLIAESEQHPSLILVDQDFSHEAAGSDEGQRVIEDLETALKSSTSLYNIYYGLLTNKVNPEDEHDRRREILEVSHLDPQKLVVISKRNLESEELERFARRMRSTLLAPTLAGLSAAVTGALAAEQRAAIDRVATIAPEELERMVIRTSEREGEWPPDMMVRVLAAMQRVKVREQLRTAPEVEELTGKLQAIAAVPGPDESHTSHVTASTAKLTTDPVGHDAAAQIMHEEFYDDGPQINALHLPIELGDILECVTTEQLWVVVAQPCALMVRPKGKREPELTHTAIAKIQRAEPGDKPLFSEFELPYFAGTDERFAVHLGRVAYPRAVIVDACVLNDDGHARLDAQAEPASRLLPHWRNRQAELIKLGDALFKRVGQTSPGALSLDTVVGHYKGDPFKPITVDAGTKLLEWDCRRVGRVGEPYARALLTRFMQYQARDAYLSDLAR